MIEIWWKSIQIKLGVSIWGCTKARTKLYGTKKELTSKNVNLTNIVDKQIVGGFVLRVGDLQYNASFKDQLKKLEQEFLNITIQ